MNKLLNQAAYSLVMDRMKELIVERLLVENVCGQKESWSLMHLLCSCMDGFGLWRNLGWKTFSPTKVREVLA